MKSKHVLRILKTKECGVYLNGEGIIRSKNIPIQDVLIIIFKKLCTLNVGIQQIPTSCHRCTNKQLFMWIMYWHISMYDVLIFKYVLFLPVSHIFNRIFLVKSYLSLKCPGTNNRIKPFVNGSLRVVSRKIIILIIIKCTSLCPISYHLLWMAVKSHVKDRHS